jgi:hypothetical protein
MGAFVILFHGNHHRRRCCCCILSCPGEWREGEVGEEGCGEEKWTVVDDIGDTEVSVSQRGIHYSIFFAHALINRENTFKHHER